MERREPKQPMSTPKAHRLGLAPAFGLRAGHDGFVILAQTKGDPDHVYDLLV
jgi:hypothetical protein